MQADIENKMADTGYKQTITRWEPWKALTVAFGAGATLMDACSHSRRSCSLACSEPRSCCF